MPIAKAAANRQGRRRRWDSATVDDAASHAIEQLWQSLPNFDRQRVPDGHRGPLEHFANAVISLSIRRFTPTVDRNPSPARLHRPDRRPAISDLNAATTIEQLAQQILDRPHDYLEARQADVLKIITDHPSATRRQQSQLAGYAHQGTLSQMLARIRRRIRRVAAEPLDHLPPQ